MEGVPGWGPIGGAGFTACSVPPGKTPAPYICAGRLDGQEG